MKMRVSEIRVKRIRVNQGLYFLQNVMKMDIDGSYKSEIVDLDRQENIAQ